MKFFTTIPLVIPAKAGIPCGLSGIQARDSRFRGNDKKAGFTLAELLIALAILGVIATFTIPKVLQSQRDSRYNAIAKEEASALSGAYQILKMNGKINANTSQADFTPYLNYAQNDTVTSVDPVYNWGGTLPCNGVNWYCYRLFNGSMLYFPDSRTFGGTGLTNSLLFSVDPDGKAGDGSGLGAGQAVEFALYYNGKITSLGNADPGSRDSLSTYPVGNGYDPPWFSWN